MLGGDHSLLSDQEWPCPAVSRPVSHLGRCSCRCEHAHDLSIRNLHGQPVAFMLKELQDKMPDIPGFSWTKPFLSARDLVYIGLRDPNPEEPGYPYFTMRDMTDSASKGLWRSLLTIFCQVFIIKKQRPIHLSFDIDAFDPSLAPPTGTPVNGGLTYRVRDLHHKEIHNT
ncbi:hypothetical protein INR49_028314, partial [Caranx melampygus]